MALVELLQEAKTQIATLKDTCLALDTKLSDVQVAVDEVAVAKFDEGFKAGIASIAAPTDKAYTQAEYDAVQAELADVKNQLEAVKAELAAAKVEIEAVKAEVEVKVAAALAVDAEADKAKVAQAEEILATI